MARPKEWKPHGTVSRYRQGGCDDLHGGLPGTGDRCDKCKAAMSEWNSQRFAGTPAEKRIPIGTVTPISGHKRPNAKPAQSNSKPSASKAAPVMGATERAIHAQFEQYRDEHAARFELLLCGARIMDDPERTQIHATTMRQMEMIIDKIVAKRKTKSGGRLAMVSAMAGRRSG